MPLLSKSEKFRKCVSGGGNFAENWGDELKYNQGRIAYASPSDSDTHTAQDTGGCDDKYWYMWSINRGLYKGLMGSKEDNFEWAESQGNASMKMVF